MNAAEIRSIREHLGLSHAELAAVLDIDHRSVRRWEIEAQTIDAGNAEELRRLAARTTDTVTRHVIDLRSRPAPVLITYRSDEDMWDVHPKFRPFPARWHRMIAARVAELVPGLTIAYFGGAQ